MHICILKSLGCPPGKKYIQFSLNNYIISQCICTQIFFLLLVLFLKHLLRFTRTLVFKEHNLEKPITVGKTIGFSLCLQTSLIHPSCMTLDLLLNLSNSLFNFTFQPVFTENLGCLRGRSFLDTGNTTVNKPDIPHPQGILGSHGRDRC